MREISWGALRGHAVVVKAPESARKQLRCTQGHGAGRELTFIWWADVRMSGAPREDSCGTVWLCVGVGTKDRGELCLPTLEAHPETRLHGEDGTEAVPGTGSRRRDVGEDAADRRSLGLGEMSGEPSHEPRGEECHQVEICPNTPFYTVHWWEYCDNPLFRLWGE